MSSTNDHLPSSVTKPRLSPLDFRNTELVSRLLAATPPYLYNMSLLPNSYFFSEMLRSLVQAKTEASGRSNMMASSSHHRRSRKRPWTMARSENYSKPLSPKSEKPEGVQEWPKPHTLPKRSTPLELTAKIPSSPRLGYENIESSTKPEDQINLFSPDNNNQGLILPPAPPMWFPPIYPSPYIDPLHFFIDLRVSGHIYDRTQKENVTYDNSPRETTSSTVVSTESDSAVRETSLLNLIDFKGEPRHNSAFSVPNSRINRNLPMNLCQIDREPKSTKFDVKSMGFEKSSNKVSSNYVMGNIGPIYKRLHEEQIGMFENHNNGNKKHVDELKTLIGLELVVDYMSKKPKSLETTCPESPAVEVVDLHDEHDFKVDIQC